MQAPIFGRFMGYSMGPPHFMQYFGIIAGYNPQFMESLVGRLARIEIKPTTCGDLTYQTSWGISLGNAI
jgi:hypothetical protein